MKTIQLTVSVEDDFQSIDQLEMYVDQLGQKFKGQLFSSMLEKMNESESHKDSTLRVCPSCKKNDAFSGEADQGYCIPSLGKSISPLLG